MKPIKSVLFLVLSIIILTSFTQCKSSKKSIKTKKTKQVEVIDTIVKTETMEQNTDQTSVTQGRGKEMPLFIRDTYFKRTKSGATLYFTTLVNQNNYKLKTVYFRGMTGEMQSGKAMHFANLKPNKGDLVMSTNNNAEYGNTPPKKPEPFPFELKANECMIKYIRKGKTEYFQVYNITEK